MLLYLDTDALQHFKYFTEERSVDLRRFYCAVAPYRVIMGLIKDTGKNRSL